MIISIFGMFMAGCSAESTDSQSLDPISSQEQSQNSGGAQQEHLSGSSTDTVPEPDYLEEVVKNMTLEQKISQMLMPSLRYETYVTDYNYVPVTELSEDMADLKRRLSRLVVAYNMDGGRSAEMYYHGKILNDPYKGGRSVSDCLIIRETMGKEP